MNNRKKRRYRRRLACLLAAVLILSAGTGSSVFAETEQTETENQQEMQDLQESETETELSGETEKEAGRITINTESGQNYIYTAANTPPAITDSGWQTANGNTLTFENLGSSTTYFIWTYIPENDFYNASAVSQPLQVTTDKAAYAVTIPSRTMTAGDENDTAAIAINQTADFDIGYGGVMTVSASENVTLSRTGDSGTTLTSALLVRNNSSTEYTAHSGNILISFDQSNYES